MFVRAYLRASTREQDANRARKQIDAFATEHNLKIASYYVEHESGSKLERPELFRLLNDAQDGDILLIEAIDRLSRLSATDWESLKGHIYSRSLRLVALDVPTSWGLATNNPDDFTTRMTSAINGLLIDVLAAVARKDYEDRRRRQKQGQERAKALGRYQGRPENKARNNGIAAMLQAGSSWSEVQAAVGCSRATVAKIAKRNILS